MERFRISACFYPTTVLFVDDNRAFLDSLVLNIDERSIIPKTFSDPLAALRFLEEDYAPSPFIERCVLHPEEEQVDHRLIDIDINAIRREVFNTARFNEISVVVVDYSMPGLNGLDLCLLIREIDPRLQILMLTAENDHNIAIQAFNEGSIDKFLRKDAPEFSTQINTTIYELQQRYFSDMSQFIVACLTQQQPAVSWLDNPEFLSLFQKTCRENNIIEYYLTDIYGSFLFLDRDARPSWLAVKDEEGMRGAYEIALYSDTPFPGDTLEAMRQREKLLYVYDGGLCSDPSLAKKWLYPTNRLHGHDGATYYYSYIHDASAYDVSAANILPYRTYLQQTSLAYS
jgi:DNA-binding NarL/FixJ family response regulator